MPPRKTVASIEKAWSNRFRRWRGYALSLTGNWTDAEEVVQDALARTLRAGPRLEGALGLGVRLKAFREVGQGLSILRNFGGLGAEVFEVLLDSLV